MSGPNPPGREPDEPDPASEPAELEPLSDDYELDRGLDELDQFSDGVEPERTAETRAYSAPESELFGSPYAPTDLLLYDYDSYDDADDDEDRSPRWPWVVGVTAILAAIALVAAVSLLVTRNDTGQLASPGTSSTSTSTTPVQDQITTTTVKPLPPPPEPPPSPSEPPPRPPETTTEIPTTTEPPPVTVTTTPPPPSPSAPPPSTTAAPAPPSTAVAAPPAPPTTTLAGPRQVTYSVTGTKAPGDIISVTYVDASGRRRTQHNVYIPWSMTVTPISQSDVGSVEASSLFRVSKLNCSIITSDGTVLSSSANDAAQTSC